MKGHVIDQSTSQSINWWISRHLPSKENEKSRKYTNGLKDNHKENIYMRAQKGPKIEEPDVVRMYLASQKVKPLSTVATVWDL